MNALSNLTIQEIETISGGNSENSDANNKTADSKSFAKKLCDVFCWITLPIESPLLCFASIIDPNLKITTLCQTRCQNNMSLTFAVSGAIVAGFGFGTLLELRRLKA